MIVQIADKVGLEMKTCCVRFYAPKRESEYVYLVSTDYNGKQETIELDASSIIELAEKLKQRCK